MKRPSQTRPRSESDGTNEPMALELDVGEGLEWLAAEELRRRFGRRVTLMGTMEGGRVPFQFQGRLNELSALRLAQSVFHVESFAIPRPKALLGDQNLRIVVQNIEQIRSILPPSAYATFHIDAAGSESAVMQRIRAEVETQTGLAYDSEQGDLLLRIRRDKHTNTWQVLTRLTPRPLSTRPWRVCNFEGALNATVAHAMIHLLSPQRDSTLLNLGCGSGTFLIESAESGLARYAIGIDHDPGALICATSNILAAGCQRCARLLNADNRQLPFQDEQFNALVADLPFGQRVGSHKENRALYPAVLAEAGRIAQPSARFALITHEIRLMEHVLANQRLWQLERIIRVTLRGLHPGIYLLRRR